jgi:hypothetical protein
MKKSGHKDTSVKSNPMGVVQWGKEWCGGATKVVDNKLNCFALSLDCTPSFNEVATNGDSRFRLHHNYVIRNRTMQQQTIGARSAQCKHA